MPSYREQTLVSRPIFFSSTFRDMHAERDLLRNDAFDQINERLRPRRHELNVIDLRQGVETAHLPTEEAREMAVLSVCLGEIERTRPFLIGLLGDRYGWVPQPERMTAAARAAGFDEEVAGRSVTELELIFAFIRNPDQRERSRIYLREMDYTGMPGDVRADYDERFAARDGTPEEQAAAADRWQRLGDLKKWLLDHYPERVRAYPAQWDAALGKVTGLEDLSRMVVADLWDDLDAHTRAYEQEAPKTWQEADERAVEEFVIERTRHYVERPDVTGPAIAFATADPGGGGADTPRGLCLTGDSGSGKSALFARIHQALDPAEKRGELLLLAHAAGIHASAGSVDRMLRRWITELAAFTGVADPLESEETRAASAAAPERRMDDPPPASAEEIEKHFASLLGSACARGRVVVLLDALNQFERSTRARHLTWLPKPWPANARFLATAIPGVETGALGRADRGLRVELRPVPPATRDEAGRIAERVFDERYHRAPNGPALEVLLDKQAPADGPGGATQPAHGNPLWLELALQEINLLEADDFSRAEREFAHLRSGAERMQALLLSEAERLPGAVREIYGELLARAERTFGEPFTRAALSLIALGRAGWRESDLQALVPDMTGQAWSDLSFAGVRRSLGHHLVQRGEAVQWDTFHAQLRQTALDRYLPGDAERRALHGRLADHLQALPEGDPLRVSETMVHLIGLGDRTRAAAYLAGFWHGHAELLAAVKVTAQHITGNEQGLVWVVSLLDAGGVSDPQRSRLANNLQFELHDELGREGNLQLSLALLEVCRVCLERLATADPSNAGWQRDLSVSQEKIGDVLRAQGDLAGALRAYRESLGVAERLATADPGNAGWQRDLSVSQEKIGDVLRAQGDLAGALRSYRESLGVRERLATADPSNAGWQRDLWVSYWRMGDMAEKSNTGDARDWWRKCHEQILAMKQRGILNPVDEKFLEVARQKAEGVQMGGQPGGGAGASSGGAGGRAGKKPWWKPWG